MWDIILIGVGSVAAAGVVIWLCVKYRIICSCDEGDDDDYYE